MVESASNIAKKFGLSDLVIGLTIVAFSTSAPEFAVTISAALAGQTSISVGNIVGSNIFNMGFILGLVAIFSRIEGTKALPFRDVFVLLAAGILLLIFFLDLRLSSLEGGILFHLLIIYIIYLYYKREKFDEEVPEGTFRWYDIPKVIIGGAIIYFAAGFLVVEASNLARSLGVSDWLIGITIVAAGTSVPELATSLVALSKGKIGISAGNLIGSDIFNILGALGLAAMFNPLSISQNEFTSLILLVVSLILLLIMMRTGNRLSTFEGVLLMLIALLRWSYDFIIQAIQSM